MATGRIDDIDTDLKVYGLQSITLVDPEDSSDKHELTFAEVLKNMRIPEEGSNPQVRLIEDVGRLASILEWRYEKGEEAAAQGNNLAVPMAPPAKQEFFNMAFHTLVAEERFGHDHTFLGLGGQNITYVPLSLEELTATANGITSLVSPRTMEEANMNPDFFDSGNQEQLQALIVEQREAAQRDPQRNAFSSQETSVSQLREQIISAQENDPNYNPVQAQGVIDFYISENPDLPQEQQEDLRSIIEYSPISPSEITDLNLQTIIDMDPNFSDFNINQLKQLDENTLLPLIRSAQAKQEAISVRESIEQTTLESNLEMARQDKLAETEMLRGVQDLWKVSVEESQRLDNLKRTNRAAYDRYIILKRHQPSLSITEAINLALEE